MTIPVTVKYRRILVLGALLCLVSSVASRRRIQKDICNHGDIRLIGGTVEYEGRVEVCLHGSWGTVGGSGWSTLDAQVVCRQLGFSTTGVQSYSYAIFGAGTGPIHLVSVGCLGSEKFLVNCTYSLTNYDYHYNDAGVRCGAPPVNCTNGVIRLMNGASPNQGRVEMCWNRAWGTITDDGWSVVDARVVCRELGYSTVAAVARTNAFYGQGTGPILRDNVGCTGQETRLRDCRFNSPDSWDYHYEDAGVQCSILDNCTHGDIRLLNGTVPSEGRVEVCIGGIWGTVADDFWDTSDARVVCGQLGYSTRFAVAVPNARFTPNNAIPILMDNVFCTGSETQLVNCSYDPNTSDDSHYEDAGVRCFSENGTNCNLGDVRLVGGTNSREGRVEVCASGVWGTICDDWWDTVDAAVVCRQLGYSHIGVVAFSNAYFGQGTGPILLDNMRCTGIESNILDCPSGYSYSSRVCNHFEDAGVRCHAGGECTNGEMRLVNGEGSFEGRVEVCVGGVWGTVCHNLWDRNDATVVCRQLGLPTNVVIPFRSAYFGQGNIPIAISNLRCNGSESGLLNCSHDTNTRYCRHYQDAGVACLNASLCDDGEVRLVGGRSPSEGRVEYCQGSVWGTICDSLWNRNDAQVVCRQLGLPTTFVTAYSRAFFGQGRGPIFLNGLRCTGQELNISNCSAYSYAYCSHNNDAGVTCSSTPECSPEWSIRLVGGSTSTEGRVEVCLHGAWGTVSDDSWGRSDALVVCRQLGFHSNAAQAFSNARFGQGTGPIHLDDVFCTGRETQLQNCTHSQDASEDYHYEDASVRCFQPGECVTGDLRLAGGNGVSSGRVEVCVGEIWGTVADDFWDDRDASVVCGQLGFSRNQSISHSYAIFGQGTAPILMDDVQCVGTEPKLVNCTFDPDASEDYHFEDAGVTCFDPCSHGDVRLVRGAVEYEGRVEVCLNETWGTVTDDGWSTLDAQVVCRQLGFSTTGVRAFSYAFFGAGSGPIHMDNVGCLGSEQVLINCSFTSPLFDYHYEDAGVRCGDPPVNCTNGEIRLVNGASPNQGRVEMCWNRAWGTITDDGWSVVDARVVCRELGYSTVGAIARTNAFYGQGTGPILRDNVGCTGQETQLRDCRFFTPDSYDYHYEDAGVHCHIIDNCTHGDIRLLNGTVPSEGRVEVCIGGIWGTVADDFWDTSDARVVCGQLGYSTRYAVAVRNARFSPNHAIPILMDNVFCTGSETQLVNCSYDPNTSEDSHFEDAGVRCFSENATNCNLGDVRLVGGINSREGRVEVCANGVWGTVCDDWWDTSDAAVVCKQLGYSHVGALAFSSAYFGQGTGSIFFSNMGCTGNEDNILDCPFGSSSRVCGHFEDAGVRCRAGGECTNGEVRLVNGEGPFEGRVEVCAGGVWGTVCHDLWDRNDATVVCRQLGLPTNVVISFNNAYFGQGSVPTAINNLRCNGTESGLLSCLHDTNARYCSHTRDAGVACLNDSLCDDGEVSLVGGSSPSEGRVEYCQGSVWGTICDSLWDRNDAQVVCRQLGLPTTFAIAHSRAFFGRGQGPIFLKGLRCTGQELNISSCSAYPYAYCSHNNDAGVTCSETPECSPDWSIRLVGGSTSTEGRVEVCLHGAWGTVSDDSWGRSDALVVCRQLGFHSNAAQAFSYARFGQGTGPIHLDDVFCTGRETHLQNCTHSQDASEDYHYEDASVRCFQPGECVTGELRLAGGNDASGRVEVCVGGVWGTVADDFWDDSDASVVCGQLGFDRDLSIAHSSAIFGQGTAPILMDDVQCVGNESKLVNCTFDPDASEDYHFEDAGVTCFNESDFCSDGDVRLVDGTNEYEGRVEVCLDETWGTVTRDGWGTVDARVVCGQLGFGTTGIISYLSFGAGVGPIHMDNVYCSGFEKALVNCSYSTPYLDYHSEDAGVRCGPPPVNCTHGEIRLVNGSTPNQGRVEMCWNRAWGTITDDGWSVVDAQVVCRELGYSAAGAVARTNAFYGEGTGPILRDSVSCTGRETRLRDCRYYTPDYYDSHYEDAGVQCLMIDNCTHGDIRLLNGTVPSEGRVEACIGGIWGTVADDFWDNRDARVVCGQLGYSSRYAVALPNARFSPNHAIPILMDNVHCTGRETRLVNCSYDSYTSEDFHYEDASVQCFSENATNCNLGDVRLVGGTNSSEGRVEVCANGVWGTVCSDLWDNVDAAVVCRQLGYSFIGAVAFGFAHFGQGTGPIYLDDMRCAGNEANIIDCPHDPNNQDCRHNQDSGVRCRVGGECTNGEVRLVGGDGSFEGRVEVCGGGVWGTVCHDLWDRNDATVVCRQLRLPTTVVISFRSAFFGPGIVPIAINGLRCNGSESGLLSCPHITNTRFCNHFEDAGVACLNASLCQDGEVRLVGGNSSSEGRVEYCQGSVWGTICDSLWDRNDAQVVCRQLGLPTTYATPYVRSFFGRGRGPAFLNGLRCTGRESNISNCGSYSYSFNCRFNQAGVNCRATPECGPEWTIRLVGGSTSTEGRVEVCLHGTWGTVSHDFWGRSDALVVCRQLGFSDIVAQAFSYSRFGQGTGPIHLDNVFCTGRETQLQNCTHSQDASEDYHYKDASVRCFQPGECVIGELRLAGGNNASAGRVEVCVSGIWGTVAGDLWDVRDAGVVCGQLGFNRNLSIAHSRAIFGQGTAPILMDNVQCVGTEPKLVNCTFDPDASEDSHYKDAGVTCFNESVNCTNGEIRLVDGPSPNQGRVEMCWNRVWGTITSNGWSGVDAQVVCRELGYSAIGAIARRYAFYGRGIGPILRDRVACTGQETRLRDCRYYTPYYYYLSHFYDAGVHCIIIDNCTHGDIRLLNGTVPSEGRVEVCIEGIWGTVADDFWDTSDARVVCGQLGYSTRYALAVHNAHFTPNHAIPILMDNVFCTGSETQLVNCSYDPYTSEDSHFEDAGVRCFSENGTNCSLGDVRLVGGTNSFEGRVEVCANDVWGTICDDLWDNVDAAVVCSQLGYSDDGAIAFTNARFGQGTGIIFLDDMRCTGNESDILDCLHDSNTGDCSHFEDAGVRCRLGDNQTVDGFKEGINYLQFLEMEQSHQISKLQDSSSPAITIPTGLPFDNSVQTQAFVSENGVISFSNPWSYSSPSRFPTSWYWTRNQYVVAPFWSDNDIRRSGSVHYVNITLGDSNHGDELINTVSKFIQHQNDEAAEQNFTGDWMLIAHWDRVHPYPHGLASSVISNYYNGFTLKENSYQAIVITDGANTYTVFTYNCNMMGWSGLWQHAVVGYNARGNSYTNHPASGFDVIRTAVACPNNLLHQVPWNNIVYKISPHPDLKAILKQQCTKLFRLDYYKEIPSQSPKDISEKLEPCPCTVWQARRDWGRFRPEFSQGLCYIQRFTLRVRSGRFTQKCCYAPLGTPEAGSLLPSGINGGSMLYLNQEYDDPFQYDLKFKETCCGLAQQCRSYYTRRPYDDCTNYLPPVRTWGWGDPHITTLDDRTYTFNGWGEYTLLEPASNTTQFVLQGRTAPINESVSNSATQFSAFAFGIPEEVSFQVGIEQGEFVVCSTQNSAEDITEYLSQVNGTYNVSDGDTEAELTRLDEDTIIATFSNGVGCTFTKSVGILNFVLALPRSFMGQTKGLLGNNNGNKTDDFVMRGTTHSLPDNLTEVQIFSFGKSWNVSESESLFSYDGSSYAMFQHPEHTPVFVAQLNPTSEQIAVCGEDQQCLYDFAQTGNKEIAVSTMKTAETNEMDSEILNNFPPNITAMDTFTVMVGQNNVFNFTVEDTDSNITVGLVGGLPTGASLVNIGGNQYSVHYRPTVVTNNETLTIVATDPHGASSIITPTLYICACANGGNCTLEGLPSSDAKAIVMNCACSQAYTGRFCEEDHDGCSAVQCYVESTCRDVPAPGVGAECGACPVGFTGDGNKCLDIDECQVNSSVCDQVCTNSAGSYTCSCEPGYKLNADNQCIDVNECLTTNDCQQQCTNIQGGYNCSCSQGFTLNSDNKTCDALQECASNHGCSDGCAIVNSTQQCFCPSGYTLNIKQCTDIDECSMFSPCQHECANTNGSYRCSCRNGYTLGNDNTTCRDVNECMLAALNGNSLCSVNSECVNTHGSYECVCVPGYDLTNGTCHRIEEVPSTPPQIVPNFAQENTYIYTIASLDITFKQARQQLFRVTTAMAINEYCSTNLCTIIPSNGDSPTRVNGLSISEQDVAIPNSLLSHNAQGQLVIEFYVQTQQGFVALATIQQSVMAGEEHYQDAGFTLATVPAIASSSVVQEISTSAVPMVTDTPPSVAQGPSALVVPVVGAVGGAVLLGILVAIVFVVTVVCVKRSKVSKGTTSAAKNIYDVIENKHSTLEMDDFSDATLLKLKS